MSLATLAHVEPVRNPLLGPELASRLVSLIRVVLTTQTGHSRAAQQLEKYSSLDLPCVFTQIPPRRVCCALIRRASPAISRTALLQIPTLDHYCTLDPDQPTNSCNSVWGLIPTQILRGEVIAAPTAPPPSFAAPLRATAHLHGASLLLIRQQKCRGQATSHRSGISGYIVLVP